MNSTPEETDSLLSYPGQRSDSPTTPNVRQYPGLGALLGGLSGFCYASCSLIIKLLHDYDSESSSNDTIIIASWVRQLISVVTFSIAACALQLNVFGRNKTENFFLVLLGLLVSIIIVAQYIAFQRIDLADANTIISSSPLFVALFTLLFTFKCCSVLDAFTVVACLGGIILCVQPPIIFQSADLTIDTNPGYFLALVACILWSLVYIIGAKIKHLGVIVLNFWVAAITAIGYSMYLFVMQILPFPQNPIAISYIFLNGVISLNAMIFLGLAVKVDDPLMVSVGRTADLVFSFAFDVAVFGSQPNLIGIAGACLVITGIVLPAAIKLYQQGTCRRNE